ncbi:MAG: DNA polymerase III subunit alpha [Clostridia bacterium]|nr:DNA polymerase III subunit alpha [Clostridia bacterium]
MGDFVHLHLHSEYSLLDGACRVSDIPKYAAAAGHKAVAITDHGVMYGAVAFYKACKKYGVKPIIGCEMYVAEGSRFSRDREDGRYHLILLVKNETGYRNLIYLVSKSFSEGFYVKPRIDMELLAEHSDGLIALSACIAGYIPQKILQGDYSAAKAMALRMKNIFGENNYYLEIQNHGLNEEATVDRELAVLSRETGIPLVATNDVHYLDKSHAEYQDVLMCIQTNETVNDERSLSFPTNEFYYKSTDEMEELFSSYGDAVSNSVKIAEACSFDFDFSKTYLPRYTCPDNKSAGEYLKEITLEGFEKKISDGKIRFDEKYAERAYLERIDDELGVIDSMGYSEYFLIVWDFVSFAKRSAIPVGPGRGSGAASLIAYLIGITDIDPVRFELIFESFLNVDRVSMPDFDIDFADNRREEVIEYVKSKYGESHVSQIITFGTMSARAVVRDVGRALGMSYSEVDRIAKMIPRELNVTLSDALKNSALSERCRDDADVRKLIDVSLALEGMPRHASTHAAGVVITDRPVYEYVPLASNGGNMLTQFDMDTVAELGLLKFDFLGIRYLTVIAEAERLIRNNEPAFSVENIPYDDEKTYKLICKGNTDGVFQLNSAGMRVKLTQMRPESFDDIIAAIALYRPGPMKAGAVDAYAENKRDRSKIRYVTPKLAPVLDATYGCLVYQEQVTQIFRELAGYSFSKADNVRRAVKKKKADVIENERERFIEGAEKNGIDRRAAEKIFSDIEGFSSYAFNKSHATAYAVTAYRTAYLKTHYLKEYYCALISSEMYSQEKVYDYITELKKAGVSVLPPDVNRSFAAFTVEGDAIRFGLLAISNVGRNFVDDLVAERRANGEFKTFESFIERTVRTDLNRRLYEMLVKAGALDSLGLNRRTLLSLSDRISEFRQTLASRSTGQMDLMSILGEEEVPRTFNILKLDEMSETDKLRYEKESLGIYMSGSLIERYSDHIERLRAPSVRDILSSFSDDAEEKRFRDGQRITVCGIVSAVSNKKTKSGDPMSFVTLDDGTGEIETIMFSSLLSKYSYMIVIHNAIAVTGTMSVKDDSVSVIANSVIMLEENRSKSDDLKRKMYVKIDGLGTPLYESVKDVILCSPGDCAVIYYLSDEKRYVAEKGLSVSGDDLVIKAIEDIAGTGSAVVR